MHGCLKDQMGWDHGPFLLGYSSVSGRAGGESQQWKELIIDWSDGMTGKEAAAMLLNNEPHRGNGQKGGRLTRNQLSSIHRGNKLENAKWTNSSVIRKCAED